MATPTLTQKLSAMTLERDRLAQELAEAKQELEMVRASVQPFEKLQQVADRLEKAARGNPMLRTR